MAGTISLSLSQQFDELGHVLAEGRLYFYRAGTVSTPQNAFYDAGLTLPLPNPFTLDAAGRIPQFFLADGSIKVVLIDKHGTTQISADNILVVGPSGGGGGGGTVDPTTVWQTGDLKARYGTGIHPGFARANGRTIGSATSGATERANADCQPLFLLLYDDPNLTVSPGPRTTAAADWAANKTIALPDWRGRNIAGLDDMGNSAAGRLTATYFGTAATVLGAAGGEESQTLLTANLPAYTPAGTFSGSPFLRSGGVVITHGGGAGSTADGVQPGTGTLAQPALAFTAQGGTSTPFDKTQPTMLATIYIKL